MVPVGVMLVVLQEDWHDVDRRDSGGLKLLAVKEHAYTLQAHVRQAACTFATQAACTFANQVACTFVNWAAHMIATCLRSREQLAHERREGFVTTSRSRSRSEISQPFFCNLPNVKLCTCLCVSSGSTQYFICYGLKIWLYTNIIAHFCEESGCQITDLIVSDGREAAFSTRQSMFDWKRDSAVTFWWQSIWCPAISQCQLEHHGMLFCVRRIRVPWVA